jgi:outer membrane protein assembly factor BamB
MEKFDMKKIFVVILLIVGLTNSIAQNKEKESSPETSINIYTKIELKSFIGVSPVFGENKIYTCEKPGIVTCFDTTGNVVWRHDLPSEIVTGPLVTDGQIAIGTANGEIISLTAHTGEQIQSLGIDDTLTTDLVAMQYEGDKELFLPKQSPSKTAILFGTSSGTIYSLDLETLQEYWRNNDSHGKIIHPPLVIQNKVLFAGSDGYLYSIDARNGLLNWRWKETETTDFSDAKIVCDGEKVFAVTKDSQLYCLDLLLGKLIWKSEKNKILSSTTLSNDKKNLFAKTDDKRFLVFSVDRGIITRQLKRGDPFDSLRTQTISYKDKIYFTNNGSIFALDKKFKEEKIFDSGETGITTFLQISNNKFLASTPSGTILIFGIR